MGLRQDLWENHFVQQFELKRFGTIFNVVEREFYGVGQSRLLAPPEARGWVLELNDWVNVFGLTMEGQLIAVEQFRFGSKKSEIEMPGGGMHTDESPILAGMRELEEETGYRASKDTNLKLVRSFNPNPAMQDNLMHVVFADKLVAGEAHQDENEHVRTFLMDPGEFPSRTQHGVALACWLAVHYESGGTFWQV